MKTFEGKCGIKATVLADSISSVSGDRLTTFEIEYPRIILAEFNTHCMLGRNSASSRAIPFPKMVETLHGRPVRFGEANPGMQDKGVDYEATVKYDTMGDTFEFSPQEAWDEAKEEAIRWSESFYKAGYHKQVYNRLLEPFQMMKTIVSATEWANFFWLREDGAADPTLRELARVMLEAKNESEPFKLEPGYWHLPYVSWGIDNDGDMWWKDQFGTHVRIDVEDAIKVSAARCAAVSFRNVDYGLEKCLQVYDRLVGDERKHASAFEHIGTPMKAMWDDCWPDTPFGQGPVNIPWRPATWQEGVTHVDRDEKLWSAKLRGFVQYRKLIRGENYTGR